ncbi:PH domain-containing protein [Terrabacter aerolatus]|uniref:PH domain-containing protein n=1 Tax=Terrabacter aerolatus TaxID=422442 RepID=UPI0016499EE4|nr:PH domain-containing protein [Terrabacter aerolatus]
MAGLLVPAWLIAIVRATRARVEVSSDGLRIRRVFGTRTIPAADYDGVTYNLTVFPPGPSLAIRRTSGHPVSAPSALDMREHPLKSLDDEVAELGQLIAAALGGPSAGSPAHSGA